MEFTATPVDSIPAQLHVTKLAKETVFVPIVGTAPLIVSKFSEKAKRKMLETQQGKKHLKEIRNPEAEFESSLYRFGDGGYGFPATGFKLATVSGARFYGRDVTMKSLLQSMFFHGELSTVEGMQLTRIHGEPKMREDMVRLSGPSRSTDLRYRAEFREWSATLNITYVKSLLSRESLLSLIDAGGMGVGVGEWRPERKGDFGTFTIDESSTVEVIDE
jgi:hypothetical protein